MPPKHGGKKQQHGGQQKPSYGSGYQSHQGQQQQSYNQNQYGNYGPPQGKQKGYNHGQGNYSSYSNSYNSPGGGGSDYNYESKFSEWGSIVLGEGAEGGKTTKRMLQPFAPVRWVHGSDLAGSKRSFLGCFAGK